MTNKKDFLVQILKKELKFLLSPLFQNINSIEDVRMKIQLIGYYSDIEIYEILENPSDLENIVKDINKLPIKGFLFSSEDSQERKKFTIISILNLIKEFYNLTSNIEKLQFRPEYNVPNFGNTLIYKISSFLIIRYLSIRIPTLYSLLLFFGEFNSFESDPLNKKTFWDIDFSNIFQRPIELLEKEYIDKKGNFRFDSFVDRLVSLTRNLNIFSYSNERLKIPTFFNDLELGEFSKELKVPFFTFEGNDLLGEFGVSFNSVKINSKTGLGVAMYGMSNINKEIILSDSWVLKWLLSVEQFIPFGLTMSSEGIDIYSLNGSLKLDGFSSFLKIRKYNKDTEPFLLMGNKNETRVENGTIGFEIGMSFEKRKEVILRLFNDEMKLFIVPKNNAFLENIIKEDLEISIGGVLSWSSIDGVFFEGSSKFEVTIPIHRNLGLLKIISGKLKVEIGNQKLVLELSTIFSTSFGPLDITVNNIGIKSKIEKRENGNIGGLNFEIPKFSPPDIIGINVKSDNLSGGGFLNFDIPNQRYTGALTLQFEKLELSAIGIITTKLPNGEKGFSMLLSINIIFATPIELGFKFQLIGVGGFIGINRTMRLDDLRNRFFSGGIKDMMFPENPLQNVNQILSDLEGVFPSEEGNHVIAPFVQLAWGTSSVVQAYFGLFVEFPFTGRVIILGRVEVALPTAETALIAINIGIEGDFNFAEHYILIKGIIEENTSHIMDYPIKGGFAFMFDWGNRPTFALSIGGFHPSYTPPKRFPSLPKLSIDMSNGDNVQIYGAFFQAITSNSVQIGIEVDVFIKVGSFSIDADFSFEALIQFNPFYFTFSLSLSIDVKWKKFRLFGAALEFDFSGPSPYRVKGYAQLQFGPLAPKLDFDISWGKDIQEYIPAIDPSPLLEKELNAKENWGTVLPNKRELGVTLKPLAIIGDTPDYILVHPSGKLEIQQNILPFNKLIETIGNVPVTSVQTYRLANFKIGDTNLPADSKHIIPSKTFFSRAHFEHFDLEESEEKLALPDFELMDAGVQFGSGELQSYGAIEEVNQIAYEDIIINKDLTAKRRLNLGNVLSRNGRALAKAAAARRFYENPIDKIEIPELTSPNFSIPSSFKIVGVDALTELDAADSFFSYADASDALKQGLKNQPKLKHTQQIISEAAFELA